MEAFPPYLTGLLAVLLLTSFVKILTTLSIVRFGFGFDSLGFGVVVLGLSLALSLMVTSAQINEHMSTQAFLSGQGFADTKALENDFRPFLERHAHLEVKQRLLKINQALKKAEEPEIQQNPGSADAAHASFGVLVSAFLVSELKEAFQLGFLFIIPFVVLDLLVANILMSLGVSQMSYAVVSLPLKILVFFAVDGWTLIAEKLLGGYL